MCPVEATGSEIEQRRAVYGSVPSGPEAPPPPKIEDVPLPLKKPYCCSKCGHNIGRVGELRGSGGFVSAVFEVQTERFSYIACGRCSYTEFYQCEASALGMLFDFLVG